MNKENVLHFSCDLKYYENHGKYLIESATAQGQFVDATIYIDKYHSDLPRHENALISFIMIPSASTRTFLSCARFFQTIRLLSYYEKVLIVDADCFVRKPIDWSLFGDADYSLFTRPSLPGTVGWEEEGTKVAAGAVYLTRNAVKFAVAVQDKIRQQGMIWFTDQVALHRSHMEFVDKLKFVQMSSTFIDWEFKEDSTIWTGKGSRKTQKNYLDEREKYAKSTDTITKA